jgi:MoxR-like ATPase
VSVEDIQALVLPVLRHRIITNFHAEADNITADQLIKQLLDTIKF